MLNNFLISYYIVKVWKSLFKCGDTMKNVISHLLQRLKKIPQSLTLLKLYICNMFHIYAHIWNLFSFVIHNKNCVSGASFKQDMYLDITIIVIIKISFIEHHTLKLLYRMIFLLATFKYRFIRWTCLHNLNKKNVETN